MHRRRGVFLIVLRKVFEVIPLLRHMIRRVRLARIFFRSTWKA
ncbi:MAG: hypothetical protein ABI612_02980 [Betaproteobacteria bacterium]